MPKFPLPPPKDAHDYILTNREIIPILGGSSKQAEVTEEDLKFLCSSHDWIRVSYDFSIRSFFPLLSDFECSRRLLIRRPSLCCNLTEIAFP